MPARGSREIDCIFVDIRVACDAYRPLLKTVSSAARDDRFKHWVIPSRPKFFSDQNDLDAVLNPAASCDNHLIADAVW